MTVIFGGEVCTVWLRLCHLSSRNLPTGAPHLDNLKTTIKRAETTRYKLCKEGWLWITNDNGERETRVTGDEPQGTIGRVHLALCPLPSFLCAHIFIEREREREMSWYEAELPLYNITAIWKSHESVTSTLRSRRLMAWGQLSKQFVPRHHSTQTCTMTL